MIRNKYAEFSQLCCSTTTMALWNWFPAEQFSSILANLKYIVSSVSRHVKCFTGCIFMQSYPWLFMTQNKYVFLHVICNTYIQYKCNVWKCVKKIDLLIQFSINRLKISLYDIYINSPCYNSQLRMHNADDKLLILIFSIISACNI